MRIISGTARGRKLASFTGSDIRPTSDRVREAIFSILLSRLGSFAGLKVLDLFAGTGAMALEALSRGAVRAVLVDQGGQAEKLIRSNLQACRLEERGTVLRGSVAAALPRLGPDPFDLIFADPPYRGELARETLAAIGESGLLALNGILCLETGRQVELPADTGTLVRVDLRRYGTTAVHLFTRTASEG